MDPANGSMVDHFVVNGFSDSAELQVPIFILVLLIYFITVSSNLTILVLICHDSYLHTPMYFFLANLSIVDMSCSTVSLHRILLNFLTGKKVVSYIGCMIQMYFYAGFTGEGQTLLGAMSYDRYVAICNPLRYHMVMSDGVCGLLAVTCCLMSFVEVLPPVVFMTRFTCYTSNELNHFFCDIVPLMKITCNDVAVLKIMIYTIGLIFLNIIPFILTFTPYIFIVFTILRIQSTTGRQKAFYTCSSHLTVVALLYVTLFCQYFRPQSASNFDSTKLFSLLNTAIVPMLNPLIYSLNNKDVKSALKRNCMCWRYHQP
ncbi:olfactory receptor 8D1-like [Phyllobates terribilis]|uniref:olfactory receptor 8D1-like n=1 Tax=Phyllobates terribilis TaxID=111132 RepID=UPI003CCB1AFA